jgi:hypothetical protein
MLSAIATDIKDFSLSADGKNAKFVLVTKHSGEIEVTVPAQSLTVFASNMARPSSSPNNADVTDISDKLPKDKSSENVTITVPKKWYVGGDPQKRVVIVVLDPKTPTQSGFALHPQAAKEVAAALVKKSDEIVIGNATGSG